MKNIMIITFGLLLLVSAVAAEGNSNVANVAVGDSMTGQIMTNAVFAQASNIDANLDGNSIHSDQFSNMEAVDNVLTGSKPDGKTFFFQSLDQLIKDTGNSNVDTQNVGVPSLSFVTSPVITSTIGGGSGLIAVGNTLTDSASSQMISQSETIEGNSNEATQNVGVPSLSFVTSPVITSTIGGDSGLIAVGNTLTDSASSQMISQSETIEGNSNNATQNVGVPNLSFAAGSAVTVSTIEGDSGLIAVGNTLTDSASSQMIGQSERIEGNSNEAIQNVGAPNLSFAGSSSVTVSTIRGDSELIAANNTLTDSASSQMISQSELIEGNSNEAIQNVGAPSVSRFGSPIMVISTIGGDSGLIAVNNTLTDSASSQMISQSETIEGNSNNATQNVGVPSVNSVGVTMVISTIGGDSGLIAVNNTLTDSASSQMISQSETIEGNSNEATQNVGVPSLSFVSSSPMTSSTIRGDSGLIAVGNTLTDSASSQMISQSETIEGNSNEAAQNVGVPSISFVGTILVGSTIVGDSGLIAVGNTLTDSASSQMISQSELIEGNSNEAAQNVGVPSVSFVTSTVAGSTIRGDSGLIAVGNTLTDSASSQMISQSETIEGNSNEAAQNVGVPSISRVTSNVIGSTIVGDSGLIAAGNTLTDSASSQMINQSEIIEGNSNAATQIANSIMTTDTLTAGGALQKINEDVHALGNTNSFSQNEALASTANTVIGGIILQQADVSSSS